MTQSAQMRKSEEQSWNTVDSSTRIRRWHRFRRPKTSKTRNAACAFWLFAPSRSFRFARSVSLVVSICEICAIRGCDPSQYLIHCL
jgi:hypothetical protein